MTTSLQKAGGGIIQIGVTGEIKPGKAHGMIGKTGEPKPGKAVTNQSRLQLCHKEASKKALGKGRHARARSLEACEGSILPRSEKRNEKIVACNEASCTGLI